MSGDWPIILWLLLFVPVGWSIIKIEQYAKRIADRLGDDDRTLKALWDIQETLREIKHRLPEPEPEPEAKDGD